MIKLDFHKVLDHVVRSLETAGYQVLRSFDLISLGDERVGRDCPNHPAGECDCQMVVLLIYGKCSQPTTFVLQNTDGRVITALVDAPGHQIEPGLPELLSKFMREAQPLHSKIN